MVRTIWETDARVKCAANMLRDFQQNIKSGVYAAWQIPTNINVMVVSPTGSGKTVVLGDILRELMWPTVAVAHRQELVGQLALALNREQVPHGIVAPDAVIRQVVQLEMDTHGRSYFQARSPIRVAGVNTLERRGKEPTPEMRQWMQQVRLAIIDEGHHALQDNIWGRSLALFPHARGLLFTAHALRADGCGLGRAADGVVDTLVVGPSCRELINRGFLTDYRLICPPSDVDISDVPIGATGDYSAPKLRAAVHRSSTIVGDIASHYLKFAKGKLGITFVVDVQAAGETAAAYRAAGVPAEVITAETPIHIRAQIMRKFRARELLQLVNVDVLGEGVDVPAVEVVSLARHTASFQLYSQQFGRALRLLLSPELNATWDNFTDAQRLALIAGSAKPKAIIIDHVGNWQRHGLPDKPREYTLDRRERGARKGPTDAIPLRTCLAPDCLQPYERVLVACPYCGTAAPAPAGRSTPEMVDGDLIELDPAALAALRGEIARIDGAVHIPDTAPNNAGAAIYRRHYERQVAQLHLRARIALYGGYHQSRGASISEMQRRFFFQFGVDVATAQTLGATDAAALEARVAAFLQSVNVVEARPA
jgi:DNA repair protein RadD